MEKQLDGDTAQLAAALGPLPEPVASPILVVVSGLPGTGKSYFARKLAERRPFAILESDFLRKVLFPQPDYSADESARLFRAVHRLIETLLARGIPLILDATNLSEHFREYLYHITENLGARLIMVRTEAPDEIVRARLAAIRANRSSSDADWAVYQKLKVVAEPIRRRHYVVNTAEDINPVLDRLVREISTGNR